MTKDEVTDTLGQSSNYVVKVKQSGGSGSTTPTNDTKNGTIPNLHIPSNNPGPIDDLRVKGKMILEDQGGLDSWLIKFKDVKFDDKMVERCIGAIVGVIFDKAIRHYTDPGISTDCGLLMLDIYQNNNPLARKEILNQCLTEFKKRLNVKLPAVDDVSVKQSSLGTCQFFAELYQGVGLLTPKIMIESVVILLETGDASSLEYLTVLLTLVGQNLETDIGILWSTGMTDHPDGNWTPDPNFMDKAFMELKSYSKDPSISATIRQSLKNVCQLRSGGWRSEPVPGTKTTEVKMDQASASMSSAPLSSKEDDEDFEHIVIVKKVLIEFMRSRCQELDLKFIRAKYPGTEILQFVEELACQVGDLDNEAQQKAAGDLIQKLVTQKLITKSQVINSLKLGLEMLHDMKAYAPKGVMAFATFLAQLFGPEEDLCWLMDLGELVKGQVEEEEWKSLVTATMYNLTLKVSGTEQFIQNLVRNTPGSDGLPIHVPSGNGPSTSASALKPQKRRAPEPPPPPRIPYHPLANPPMPPNWEASLLEAGQNLTPFMRIPVAAGSAEYAVLATLLQPHLAISKLDRIVNPELWRRFCNTRKELLCKKSEDMELLTALGLSDPEIAARKHVLTNWTQHSGNHPLEPYSENMTLLFHCTRTGRLDDIFSQGLDERLGNAGSFGKGIYFADNPQKSMGYDAHFTLLIFAVLLGDCSTSASSGLVREPRKERSQQRNPADLFFDSTVALLHHNEYVVFNRNQCCPLYAVTYGRGGGGGAGILLRTGLASQSYGAQFGRLSRARFTTQTQSQNPQFNFMNIVQPLATSNPAGSQLDARTLFQQMEEDELKPVASGNYYASSSTSFETKPPPSKASIAKMMAHLNDLGFLDDTLNLTLLEIHDFNLEETVDSFLEGAAAAAVMSFKPSVPGSSKSTAPIIGMKWKTRDKEPEGDDKECGICYTKFTGTLGSTNNMKTLECSHQLCMDCYNRIGSTGTTMSGVRHTFMKCPFCLASTGLEIGSCPNGTMTVTEVKQSAAGYEGHTSLMIQYNVAGSPGLNRVAYVPNSPEGREVVDLLRKAWDRRLCFSIGTSMTTGRKNVLVWNIHHKSALSGGVQTHGYPDPTYLTRVKQELAQYSVT